MNAESQSFKLLRNITSTIEQSGLGWLNIASAIHIDTNDVTKIKNKTNPTIEFVLSLTNRIWKDIFSFMNISYDDNGKYTEITNVIKLGEILFGNKTNDVQLSNQRDVNVVHEISSKISRSKIFGRVLGLKESTLNQVAMDYDSCYERNFQIMKNISLQIEAESSWLFWRKYLEEFDEGKLVIKEMETENPILLQQMPTTSHISSSQSVIYIGHPYDDQSNQILNSEKNSAIVSVRLGTDHFPITDYQEFKEWVQTQQRYIDTYHMLKELKVINFIDTICPLLEVLKLHLIKTNDIGFAAKGYNFVNELCLFKKGVFPKHVFNDTYFAYFANNNIVLYITKCSKGVSQALYHSMHNIQIANTLHEELRSYNITQVNVIVYSPGDSHEIFCKQCVDNKLFLSEEVFTDFELFTSWYESIVKIKTKQERKITEPLQSPVSVNRNEICELLKKDMITYEALETEMLPSFSYCYEDQIEELKKLVLLSPTQYEALHSNQKHMLLRGSYGCGKSLVLFKKFEEIVNNMNNSDIVYLICHDQQSDFIDQMKDFQLKFPTKNIITVRSDFFRGGSSMVLKLSVILNDILKIWKKRTVHILIDEFRGSFITRIEIVKLKGMLEYFGNSNIVIALQSMEEKIVEAVNIVNIPDEGYKLEELIEETSFVCYNLDYSLRNSREINEFVKATSEVFESSNVSVGVFGNTLRSKQGGDLILIYDQQCRERSERATKERKPFLTKVLYNQIDTLGHSVSCGPVNVYHAEENEIGNQNDLYRAYIATLAYILQDFSEDTKFVICTYDEDLYNIVHYFLCKSQYKWTTIIWKFMKNEAHYNLLLTDYASVRGYEFSNFIFLLPFGKKYLIFQAIECMTRATSKLHIITDETNRENESMDKQLLEKWKELKCVNFINLKCNRSNDTFYLLRNKDELHAVRDFSKICVGKNKRYPWNDVKLEREGSERDKDINLIADNYDHINVGLLCVINTDNVTLLIEFSEMNNVDLKSYEDISGNNVLHYASECGAVNILKLMINVYHMNVNCINKSYKTPLHFAFIDGYTKIIKLLIERNADINTCDTYGNKAIHDAVNYGHKHVIDLLIEKGVNVNVTNNYGMSPIHNAAAYGHVNVINSLIMNQVDINIKDNQGNTPLDYAVSYGQKNVEELLIENGADINATAFRESMIKEKNEMCRLM